MKIWSLGTAGSGESRQPVKMIMFYQFRIYLKSQPDPV